MISFLYKYQVRVGLPCWIFTFFRSEWDPFCCFIQIPGLRGTPLPYFFFTNQSVHFLKRTKITKYPPPLPQPQMQISQLCSVLFSRPLFAEFNRSERDLCIYIKEKGFEILCRFNIFLCLLNYFAKLRSSFANFFLSYFETRPIFKNWYRYEKINWSRLREW